MSSKESGSFTANLDKQLPHRHLPSLELLYPESSHFPDTAGFIHSYLPDKAESLIPVLDNPQLMDRVDKVSEKIRTERVSYGSDEFWLHVNLITSDIFEVAGHREVQRYLKERNPNLFVSSPYYTKMMYGIDETNKRLTRSEWTEADFLVFERDDLTTYLVGAGEITGELNIGDPNSARYVSSHKFKQLQHYQSGRVIDDLYNKQSSSTKRKMGRFIQSLFPEGHLSNKLVFDPDRYFSMFALPDERDIPPIGIDEIIRVPLSSNDSYFTALGMIHEATYGSDTLESSRSHLPSQPKRIPIRPINHQTIYDIAAGD